MKTISFINGPGCGGAENMTFLFSSILSRAGFNCNALIIQSDNTYKELSPNIPKDLSVEVKTLRFRYFIFEMARFLRAKKPDIVFCSFPDRSHLLILLKLFGIYKNKVVIRENNMPSRHSNRINFFSKVLYRYADVIISQTLEMKTEIVDLYNVNSHKVIVINNPINGELIKERLSEQFEMDHAFTNYVAIGRLAFQKDYHTLIDAFSKLLKLQPNSRLYIVGGENEKEYADSLYEHVRQNKLQSSVFFEGFQPNPIKYLSACDVYVLSSRYEGLPNAMLEAMYVGKPVVATECIPYIKTVIKNGVNGYICGVGDIEELSNSLYKAKSISGLPLFNDVNNSESKLIDLFNLL